MAKSKLQTCLSSFSFQPLYPATPLFARLRSPQESAPSRVTWPFKVYVYLIKVNESALLQVQGRDKNPVEYLPILGKLGWEESVSCLWAQSYILHCFLKENGSAQALQISLLTLGQSLQYHWLTRTIAQNNSRSVTTIPSSSGRSPLQVKTSTQVPLTAIS